MFCIGLLVSKNNGTSAVPSLSGGSPDSPFPYQSFGGVRRFAGRTETLGSNTNTICSIQAPAATSTLVSGALRLDINSATSSGVITIARGSTSTAMTAVINQTTFAGGGIATIRFASTTLSSVSEAALIFSPNDYIVVNMASSTGATVKFSPTGICQATWEQI